MLQLACGGATEPLQLGCMDGVGWAGVRALDEDVRCAPVGLDPYCTR